MKLKNRYLMLIILFVNEFLIGGTYVWSVFSKPLAEMQGWNYGDITFAYSLMLLLMAFVGIVGGKLLDRFGPTRLMIASGMLWGLGWFLTGFANSIFMLYLSFGVCCGVASGLFYNPGITTAVRWFPDKKGFASGVIVGAVGLSPLAIAPIANALLSQYDVMTAFKIIGGVFFLISIATTWYIATPPKDYSPSGEASGGVNPSAPAKPITTNMDWKAMLKDRRFYLMWFILLGASVSGLMMTGHGSAIGQEVAGISAAQAALLVGIMAVANFFGRILMGALSDRLGRYPTLIAALIICTADLVVLSQAKGFFIFVLCLVIIGMCFGGVMSIFPTITSEVFGMRDMGLNYGIMFTSYGIAAVIGPMMASILHDITGNYSLAFVAAALFSLVSFALLIVLVRLTKRTSKSRPKD